MTHAERGGGAGAGAGGAAGISPEITRMLALSSRSLLSL
jgi:hypothetical protein